MEINMKCTQCGCTEFIDAKEVYTFVHVITSDGESGDCVCDVTLANKKEIVKEERNFFNGQLIKQKETVYNDRGYLKAYVCKKCGHIEFFCDTYIKKEIEEQEKIEAEEKRINDIIVIEKELARNEIKLQEIQSLVKNENITVKQLREYQEQINELESEASSLRAKLKSLKR